MNTKHKNCKTVYYDFEFNYNKCLNYGVNMTSNNYVCLCNNDLEFEKNWAINITRGMEFMNCQTSSPFSRYTIHEQVHKVQDSAYKSFQVGREFLGWCIMCKREIFSKIKLSEFTKFWYSDNLLNEQLKRSGKKHALVCNSIVEHVGGGTLTLRSSSKKLIEKYTRGQYGIYKRELKRYANAKRI